MEACTRCRIFINDWFSQPLSPQHILYGEIQPKRLARVLPQIALIFIRLIKGLTYYDITGIFFAIEHILIDATLCIMFEPKDVVDDKLLRLSWTSMADHYIRKSPGEIQMIQDILKDACVCKGTASNEKELIGYYLTNMIINIKEVHSCHVNTPSLSPGDTVIGRDEVV